jgi:hypothetical protein
VRQLELRHHPYVDRGLEPAVTDTDFAHWNGAGHGLGQTILHLPSRFRGAGVRDSLAAMPSLTGLSAYARAVADMSAVYEAARQAPAAAPPPLASPLLPRPGARPGRGAQQQGAPAGGGGAAAAAVGPTAAHGAPREPGEGEGGASSSSDSGEGGAVGGAARPLLSSRLSNLQRQLQEVAARRQEKVRQGVTVMCVLSSSIDIVQCLISAWAAREQLRAPPWAQPALAAPLGPGGPS